MSNNLSAYEMVLAVGGIADGTVHQVPNGIVEMVNSGQAYSRVHIGVGGGNNCSVFVPRDQEDKSVAALITALIKGYKP